MIKTFELYKKVVDKNKKTKIMKKWEYRIENITTGDFTKEKSLKEIKDFLSAAGSEGWELINVVSTGQKKEGMGANWFNTKKCLFIFKRELK